MKPAALAISLLCLTGLLGWSTEAAAASPVYSVHLGVNQPPRGSDLPVLSFADDDAARFYEFMRPFAKRSLLFTVLDADSQRLHPDLAASCRPPRKEDLESAIGQLATSLAADERAGDTPVVFFTYSGHGLADRGRTSLALLDGNIDQAWLERNLLVLPAKAIHLVVDACHAEGLVKARGVIAGEVDAATRALAPGERAAFVQAGLLERYPNVGALLAASEGRQSHEWSAIRAGVFTHELLSGLSGAADVNADGRVAYSEASAFIAAANRSVVDPRARPRLVSLPPKLDRNTPLMAVEWLDRPGLLRGRAGRLGHFQIEDERGIRLVDAHLEPGSVLRLLLPPARRLWIRSGEDEAAFETGPGKVVDLASLRFAPLRAKARGAVTDALRRGLFAHPYGPDYYRGYVDSQGEPGVRFATDPSVLIGQAADRPSTLPAAITLGGAGLGLLGGLVFGGLAIDAHLDYRATTLERPAKLARDRRDLYQGLAIGSGALCAALAVTAWLLWPDEPVVVAPMLGPAGDGLALHVRF